MYSYYKFDFNKINYTLYNDNKAHNKSKWNVYRLNKVSIYH